MWKQAFLAAAVTSFAAPAAAQIVVTSDGYDTFTGGTYIEDVESAIVLTLQRELGQSGMNIRGPRDADGQWRVEFFCEPDNVLITEEGRRTRSYYLPYLTWSTTHHVTDDAAIVEARRLPSMGTIASLLPADIEPASPEADILVRHQLRRGARLVESLVAITNRADRPQRMTYVYQDAAFMWFPDGDQRNTESVRFTVSDGQLQRYFNTESSGTTTAGHWQFVGTFNREHGIVAGIISLTPNEVAGITGDYIGVRGVNIENKGFYQSRRDFRQSDIVPIASGRGVRELPYINRYVALDFGEMAPGETRTMPYFRIMAVLPPEQRTNEGIEAWVLSSVTHMHREAALRAAMQQSAQAGAMEPTSAQ